MGYRVLLVARTNKISHIEVLEPLEDELNLPEWVILHYVIDWLGTEGFPLEYKL